MEIGSRTLIPLFKPGSVHSSSASRDDCVCVCVNKLQQGNVYSNAQKQNLQPVFTTSKSSQVKWWTQYQQLWNWYSAWAGSDYRLQFRYCASQPRQTQLGLCLSYPFSFLLLFKKKSFYFIFFFSCSSSFFSLSLSFFFFFFLIWKF